MLHQSVLDEYDCKFEASLRNTKGELLYEWKIALTKEQAVKIITKIRGIADDAIENC